MELYGSSRRVTFGTLQARLINAINARVRNGEFSERGLARVVGISQPQIHNVLKGTRKLAPELADKLLQKLELSLVDLIDPAELGEQPARRYAAPLLTAPVQLPPIPALHSPAHLPRKKSPGQAMNRREGREQAG